MIKLVASDLDGTLLFKGAQSLPEEIFPLIRQLKKMGILFVNKFNTEYNYKTRDDTNDSSRCR